MLLFFVRVPMDGLLQFYILCGICKGYFFVFGL